MREASQWLKHKSKLFTALYLNPSLLSLPSFSYKHRKFRWARLLAISQTIFVFLFLFSVHAVPLFIYLCSKKIHIPSLLCLLLGCSFTSDSLWPHGQSPTGSSVHGIFQARILEWVATSYSRESSQHRDWICVSCISALAGEIFTTEPSRKPPLIIETFFSSPLSVCVCVCVCVCVYAHVCLVVQLLPALCGPIDCWPPGMEFSRQEYWSGLPFSTPGDLPDPLGQRIKLIPQAQLFHESTHEDRVISHSYLKKIMWKYLVSAKWKLLEGKKPNLEIFTTLTESIQ